MNKTYITIMPDKAGAFLKASQIISKEGGNIVRVNYNKTVDIHTLFIEVNADETQHEKITQKLNKLGYLSEKHEEKQAILIVLKLPDVIGAITPALKIIDKYDINITYMNSQENGTPFQYFKMGLLVENANEIKKLLEELSKICEVKILDYKVTEKNLDNTVFYISFANQMRELLNLNQEQTNSVIINSNKIMQFLEERNESPIKTFEFIQKFADFIVSRKGTNFKTIISSTNLTENTKLHLIQVPCGSSTMILENGKNLFCIDSGFSCYKDEMLNIFNTLFKDFDEYHKEIALTHADIDHTGLIDIFDAAYMTQSCLDNFRLEQKGEANFREQNPLHAPYCQLSRIITNYKVPALKNVKVIGKKIDDEPFSKVGELSFCDVNFEVWEGNGGHVKGETVFVCPELKIIFTGDIVVNIEGFSKDQKEFNLLAPYLMTSVNVDSKKAKFNREFLTEKYKGYTFYPSHGSSYLNKDNLQNLKSLFSSLL